VVCLIKNRDLNVVQVDVSLLGEVFETTGSRDDDVHSATQAHDLTSLRHATVHRGGEQADRLSQRLDGAVDLHRELTGRSQNERASGATILTVFGTVVLHQALHERGTEGNGLARTSAATAENVFTLQNLRDGRSLDGERCGGTELSEGAAQVGTEANVAEAQARYIAGLDGLCLQTLENDVFFGNELGCFIFGGVKLRAATAVGRAVIARVRRTCRTVITREAVIAVASVLTGRALGTVVTRTFGTVLTVEARTLITVT
jgi:hypothetical protein